MTRELSAEQITLIKNTKWVIFATSNLTNYPRAIVVQPSRIEKNRIILSNIQMNTSIENVKRNTKCFINVYCQNNSDMQIKITGIAHVYEDGDLYDEIKNYEETHNLPDTLKVRSIVVIDFEHIEVTQE